LKPIIEVQGLSKKYQIIANRPRYLSLRDSITDIFKLKNQNKKEDFWALQDINFTIEAGESIGIIGKNGAGKSTLLKILSRITPPTKGSVVLRGRLASLLEVGTGFHPELSGRENVYFNGSILGLKKAEIDKKFDEIIDFSGVESFIETPLKHYSSGMKLRLAFAVAAHLEPEILIIDEVLAVGDTEFQKKCLGKMDDVSKSGRTVLFVSHNLGAVQKLCSRGIVLNKGIIDIDAPIDKAVEVYSNTEQDVENAERYFKVAKEIGISKLTILNSANQCTTQFCFGEPFEIRIDIETSVSFKNMAVVIGIDNQQNERLFTCSSDHINSLYEIEIEKKNRVSARFENLILHPGTYHVFLSLRIGTTVYDNIFNAGSFNISTNPFEDIYPYIGHWGIMRINPVWS
jgi:lipopolysaccharide transport system ATP-binding protein